MIDSVGRERLFEGNVGAGGRVPELPAGGVENDEVPALLAKIDEATTIVGLQELLRL
jgi:hypothetical protein